ncbi:MAG TPA: PAS domain S-box protein [Allosphingosinicella sp.]
MARRSGEGTSAAAAPAPDGESVAAENERLRQALAQSEEALGRLSARALFESQIRLVADALPVLIAYVDAGRSFRYNNKAFERWFGGKRRDMIGRPVRDVFGDRAYSALTPLIERALAGERVAEELLLPVEEGAPRFIRLDYVPHRGEDGTVAGFYALFQDVSASKRSELKLRESEARFRSMADCAPAPVWVTGTAGIEFVNRAFVEMVGAPAEELTGETWMKLIHPDDLPPVLEERARAWSELRAYSYHARFRRHDGELRWMHVSCNPRHDEGGRLLGYVGMAVDLTEQKQAEDELRESEDRLRLATEAAAIGTWDFDPIGGTLRWDQRCKFLFGLPADGHVDYDVFLERIHPEDRERADAAVNRALDPAGPGHFDVEYRTIGLEDGVERWIAATGRPIFEGGRATRFIGTVIDVSERKRAEAALAEKEEALRDESRILQTLNRVGASLAGELDLERVVQTVTDAGVALTGAQFGAFFYNVLNEGGESYMLYTISGVDRSEFDKFPMPRNTDVFAPTFQGEGVVRSDDITRDPRYGHSGPHYGMPEGHLPVTSYLAVPVTSRSGGVIGGLFFGHAEPGRFTARHEELLVGIAGQASVAFDNARLFEAAQREIAERRRAEEALRELNLSLEARIEAAMAERERAEQALRQAQKMEAVGQLTGGIAHDFNNLLTVISGNLDLAARRLGSEADPKMVRAIANASVGADRAATLTQRLLAFSRRQPLAPKSIDPNGLIVGMTELLHRTLGETIVVETRLAAGLARIEVDPHQLESAILNLAVNARDAMPSGGHLVIETSTTRLDAGNSAQGDEIAAGQYVMISVADSGTGMDPATVKRAVEPFFTTKEVGRGTGLGLSMVYGFVRQSGGHLAIDSEPGKGSVVRVYLPKLHADPVEEEQAREAPAPRAGGDETILVCEDDDDVRTYTVELLGELGYRVLAAPDGPTTLSVLRKHDHRVDLLFTDVVLPGGMSGAELANEARAARPGLKVLFTTGYARDAIVHDGRLDPGVELVAKPFSFTDLAARIRDVLDRN